MHQNNDNKSKSQIIDSAAFEELVRNLKTALLTNAVINIKIQKPANKSATKANSKMSGKTKISPKAEKKERDREIFDACALTREVDRHYDRTEKPLSKSEIGRIFSWWESKHLSNILKVALSKNLIKTGHENGELCIYPFHLKSPASIN